MHPRIDELQEIYNLWKEEFSFDDNGYTDDFFKRNFSLEHCFILRIEDTIVATLCAYPKTIRMEGKEIPSYFISGVITKKQYRHKGYMHMLFHQVFELYNKSCALFLLQAYNPKIYTSLNFHMYYSSYIYEIQTCTNASRSIVIVDNPHDMQMLATAFLAQYEGYISYDVNYYTNYLLEARAQGAIVYGIYEHSTLCGFARLDIQEASIDDIMYRDEASMQSLIAYAQQRCGQVTLQSFIPLQNHVLLKKQGAMMVRLHNKELLKNILKREITTLEDVYHNHQKPLYHYGFW